jgi:hypothetical protein
MSYYNPFMPDLSFSRGMVLGGGGSKSGGGSSVAVTAATKAAEFDKQVAADYKTLKATRTDGVKGSGWGEEFKAGTLTKSQLKAREQLRAEEKAAEAKRLSDIEAAKAAAEAKAVAASQAQATQMAKDSADLQAKVLADPSASVTKAEVGKIDPNADGTNLAAGTGQLTGAAPQIDDPAKLNTSLVTPATVTTAAKTALSGVNAATGTVSDGATVAGAQGQLSDGSLATGATMDPANVSQVIAGTRKVTDNELASAAGQDAVAVKSQIATADVPPNIKAAQTQVNPNEIPVAAQILESDMAQAEVIMADGLSDDATAVAAKLANFSVSDQTLAEFKEGKIEAQDTVQGQLAQLMLSFEDGTPAWAAGAMRAANAAMNSRGLGGSSMAGAAIVQAAMESAIPIAAQDANAFREMKMDNLSRQQQVSLTNAAAQQGVKISNFNAQQQAALQNSQNSFALQSQNLSNMQSVVLANAQIKASLQGQNLSNQQQANLVEAARYAEVSNLNLNNRQQGILQDNTNRMNVNLANASSKQQAYLANAQLAAALQGKKIDNQQQVAILNAAKFAEANNLSFSAAEQAKIHNSELLKTIGLAELNGRQAATLQNAAAMASMDMANLNNRQQAAVINAQSFLATDMKNLDNEQQTSLFKAQAMQQALFTDQAAENASRQFNASSQNQTDQFFASMATQVQQFNAGMEVQRDQFNSTNALVVAQANAQWRQNATTLNTAAQNEANMADAMAANGFTQSTMDVIWQRERDMMDYAFRMSESSTDRALSVFLADKQVDLAEWQTSQASKDADSAAKGYLFTKLLFG